MNASLKWLQLFLDILTYEVDHSSDGQLLSEGADRLVEKYPIAGRAFILCVGVVLTLHLSNAIPSHLDPVSKTFWRNLKGR